MYSVFTFEKGTFSARKDTRYLNLSKKGLTEVPNLSDFTELRVLNLSHNHISEIPSHLLQNKKLHRIDLQFNGVELDAIPEFLRVLPHLIGLDSSSVQIRDLPVLQRVSHLYKDLPKETQDQIRTLLLVNRFYMENALPIEILELIFVYLSTHHAEDYDKWMRNCCICRNHLDSVCIECEGKEAMDDEFCKTIVDDCAVKHEYHRHCIRKWLKCRKVCPLSNKPWTKEF